MINTNESYYKPNEELYYESTPSSTTILIPTNIRKSMTTTTNNNSTFIKNIPVAFTSDEYTTSTILYTNCQNNTSNSTPTRSPYLAVSQLKCNRCDKITRKFESVITCSNPICGKLFHKRCVIFPYASSDQDFFWKCDECENAYGDRKSFLHKPVSTLTRSGTSFKTLQTNHRPNKLTHSNTTIAASSLPGLQTFKYEDGRTHICNKAHTPRTNTLPPKHIYSRENTASNTPVLSRSNISLNSQADDNSCSSCNRVINSNEHTKLKQKRLNYAECHDESILPIENEAQLKLAQVLDISNDLNVTSSVCEDMDIKLNEAAHVEQQPQTIASTLLSSVSNDKQNKIYVKLNIRPLEDASKSKSFEFVLNDEKKVDANSKQQQKQKILKEIEINEEMIKTFDNQFDNLIQNGIANEYEIGHNNPFSTFEEAKAYMKGQRKGSDNPPPPFSFRYEKNDKLPESFFYFTGPSIENDEQHDEEINNVDDDTANNNSLINYDNLNDKKEEQNFNFINLISFKKEEKNNLSEKPIAKGVQEQDEQNMTISTNEGEITILQPPRFEDINKSPVVAVSPVPVPLPPPSNMISFQHLKPNDFTNKLSNPTQTSHPADIIRMKEMERKLLEQDEKLRLQQEKIEDLTNAINRMKIMQQSQLSPIKESDENKKSPAHQDAFIAARDEGIKEDDSWRVSLIDDLSLIFAKYLVSLNYSLLLTILTY